MLTTLLWNPTSWFLLHYMHLCIIINPPYNLTSISHLQFHPPSIYLVQKPTHGAPSLHHSHSLVAPPKAKPYFIGAPVSIHVLSTQLFLIYLVIVWSTFQILGGSIYIFHRNRWHIFPWNTLTHFSLCWGISFSSPSLQIYPYHGQIRLSMTHLSPIFVFWPIIHSFTVLRIQHSLPKLCSSPWDHIMFDSCFHHPIFPNQGPFLCPIHFEHRPCHQFIHLFLHIIHDTILIKSMSIIPFLLVFMPPSLLTLAQVSRKVAVSWISSHY